MTRREKLLADLCEHTGFAVAELDELHSILADEILRISDCVMRAAERLRGDPMAGCPTHFVEHDLDCPACQAQRGRR